MIKSKLVIYMFIFITIFLVACNNQTTINSVKSEPHKLIIHTNGSMEFRHRLLPTDDVVIYQDGRGGERAAVKMYVPLHPDYYRDSIIVERR